MGFHMDVGSLSGRLARLDADRLKAQRAYAHTAAGQLEGYAKAHAPWRDESGQARRSIRGMAECRSGSFTISLCGGAPHMVYLELAHGGRRAILRPAMQRHARRILRGFAENGGMK